MWQATVSASLLFFAAQGVYKICAFLPLAKRQRQLSRKTHTHRHTHTHTTKPLSYSLEQGVSHRRRCMASTARCAFHAATIATAVVGAVDAAGASMPLHERRMCGGRTLFVFQMCGPTSMLERRGWWLFCFSFVERLACYGLRCSNESAKAYKLCTSIGGRWTSLGSCPPSPLLPADEEVD